MTVIVNDLSEHQQRIDWAAHRSARQAVIIRAHNGLRPDTRFTENRAGARPLRAVGIYQYLVESRDPAVQAREFVATVGRLNANEWPVLDIEEGAGVTAARARAWLAVVEAALGRKAWIYSGDNRWQTTDLAAAAVGRHRWVARYSDTHQPVTAWTLWQRASDAHAPGVATLVDESYFPGDIDSFVTLAIGADDDMPYTEAQLDSIVTKAVQRVMWQNGMQNPITRALRLDGITGGVAAIGSAVQQVATHTGADVDEQALAAQLAPLLVGRLSALDDDQIQAIAVAVADEQARRQQA